MFKQLGVFGVLYSLIPVVISLIVLGVFTLTGYKALVRTNRKSTEDLLIISLMIQVFQLSLMGVQFKNYFGPYMAFGFSDTPMIRFLMDINWFGVYLANGFRKGTDEISIVVNVVPALLLYIFFKLKSKHTEREALGFSF